MTYNKLTAYFYLLTCGLLIILSLATVNDLYHSLPETFVRLKKLPVFNGSVSVQGEDAKQILEKYPFFWAINALYYNELKILGIERITLKITVVLLIVWAFTTYFKYTRELRLWPLFLCSTPITLWIVILRLCKKRSYKVLIAVWGVLTLISFLCYSITYTFLDSKDFFFVYEPLFTQSVGLFLLTISYIVFWRIHRKRSFLFTHSSL